MTQDPNIQNAIAHDTENTEPRTLSSTIAKMTTSEIIVYAVITSFVVLLVIDSAALSAVLADGLLAGISIVILVGGWIALQKLT